MGLGSAQPLHVWQRLGLVASLILHLSIGRQQNPNYGGKSLIEHSLLSKIVVEVTTNSPLLIISTMGSVMRRMRASIIVALNSTVRFYFDFYLNLFSSIFFLGCFYVYTKFEHDATYRP